MISWLGAVDRRVPRAIGAGPVDWYRTAGGLGTYGSGFMRTNLNLISSQWNPVSAPEYTVDFLHSSGTNKIAFITMEKGGLGSSIIVSNVLLSELPYNKFTSPVPNTYTLKLSGPAATVGLMKGSFMDGANKRALVGVVLQDQAVVRGYFLGTSETGSFLLQGQ